MEIILDNIINMMLDKHLITDMTKEEKDIVINNLIQKDNVINYENVMFEISKVITERYMDALL